MIKEIGWTITETLTDAFCGGVRNLFPRDASGADASLLMSSVVLVAILIVAARLLCTIGSKGSFRGMTRRLIAPSLVTGLIFYALTYFNAAEWSFYIVLLVCIIMQIGFVKDPFSKLDRASKVRYLFFSACFVSAMLAIGFLFGVAVLFALTAFI